MGKIRILSLGEEERKILKEGYRAGKSHSFRQRCQMVLLKSEGRKSKEVANILQCNQIAVNNWLSRYEAEGIEGLKTRAGRGRKAKLDVETDKDAVRAAIQANRQRISIAKAELEEQLGKAFSVKTLQRFLKKVTADINESEKQ